MLSAAAIAEPLAVKKDLDAGDTVIYTAPDGSVVELTSLHMVNKDAVNDQIITVYLQIMGVKVPITSINMVLKAAHTLEVIDGECNQKSIKNGDRVIVTAATAAVIDCSLFGRVSYV